jgi:hypothetical protein
MKVVCNLHPSPSSRANVIIRRLGERLDAAYQPREAPLLDSTSLLVQWGFKATPSLLEAISLKVPYVILDMGYWEEARTTRQSISINGLHGLAMPTPEVLDLPPRWHPTIAPWVETNGPCLIVGQMTGDAAMRGVDPEIWMRKQAGLAVEATGRRAQLRPHPNMLNTWEPKLEPIEKAVDDASVVVTFSSNVGVTSLLRGKRTIATHPGSPAYLQAHPTMRLPGRQGFFHQLSYRDYQLSDNDEADAAANYIIMAYPNAKQGAERGEVEMPRRAA